jgi:hypothetical protein
VSQRRSRKRGHHPRHAGPTSRDGSRSAEQDKTEALVIQAAEAPILTAAGCTPDPEIVPVTARSEALRKERNELLDIWRQPTGFYGFLVNTNHKAIGLRFILTAFGFFTLAGILAAVMRLQLSRPLNTVLGPDLYNQFFTTHGSAMMFLFAVPVMEGFGLYFVPLMIGARNVAFPRLMAFSYWMYLIAGLALFTGLFLNMGPDMG